MTTYELKQDTFLYKGFQVKDSTKTNPLESTNFTGVDVNKFKWFTKEHWNAEVYGQFKNGKGSVWIYKVVKSQRLLDFSNPGTKRTILDYITANHKVFFDEMNPTNGKDKIFEMFKIKCTSAEDLKNKLLFPFGLCSLSQQFNIKYENKISAQGDTGESLQRCSYHTYDKLFVFF